MEIPFLLRSSRAKRIPRQPLLPYSAAEPVNGAVYPILISSGSSAIATDSIAAKITADIKKTPIVWVEFLIFRSPNPDYPVAAKPKSRFIGELTIENWSLVLTSATAYS